LLTRWAEPHVNHCAFDYINIEDPDTTYSGGTNRNSATGVNLVPVAVAGTVAAWQAGQPFSRHGRLSTARMCTYPWTMTGLDLTGPDTGRGAEAWRTRRQHVGSRARAARQGPHRDNSHSASLYCPIYHALRVQCPTRAGNFVLEPSEIGMGDYGAQIDGAFVRALKPSIVQG
jgi:hypothetical protein